jgi:zinc/manganese transport system permease protein
MLAYSFMLNALVASWIIASCCAIVSVFIVLRRTAFAAHALGHMSLTGAAAATLLGFPALSGQLLLNMIAAVLMGFMGDRIKKNDLVVGVVLSFVLGLGVYFLFLFQNNYAGSVMNILVGNIFAVTLPQIILLAGLTLGIVIALTIVGRPLLFASLDPVIAAAKHVPMRALAIVFFLMIAITVSMACQVVGSLLVFVLLIIPGAIACQWKESIYGIISVSMLSANFSVSAAIYAAYCWDLPPSFCISMILCGIYLLGLLYNRLAKR